MPSNNRDPFSEIAIVKSEIIHLRKDVNRLLDILLEHPEHSLTPRMKIVERQTEGMMKTLDKMEEQAFQIKLALFGSFCTFITSIAVLVFELGFRK